MSMPARALQSGAVVAARYEVLGAARGRPGYLAHRAFDRDVEVEVALWCVDGDLFPTGEQADALLRRALETRAINHPNIRRLFDAGRDDGELYATVQLASGELGERMVAGTPAELDDFLRVAAGVCDGLDAAHDLGLVHGRLTPGDVVQVGGLIKIGGVGLWHDADEDRSRQAWRDEAHYVAPEAWMRGGSSPRSDVYSAAVILAELACGTAALAGLRDVRDVRDAVATHAPDVAAPLIAATSDLPEVRPTSTGELLEALRRALIDDKVPTGRHAPVAGAVRDDVPTGQHQPAREVTHSEEMDTLDRRVDIPAPPDAAGADEFGGPSRAYDSLEVSVDMREFEAVPVGGGRAVHLPLRADPTAVGPVPKPPKPPVSEESMTVPVPRVEPSAAMPPVGRQTAERIELAVEAAVEQAEREASAPIQFGRALQQRERSGLGTFVLLGGLAAVGMAAIVWVLLAVVYDDRDEAPAPAPAPPPPAEPVVVAPATDPAAPCPDGMALVGAFCVDRYESPGKGRLPQTGVTLAEAAAACAERGARLCTSDEWEAACRGEGESSWPYGWTFRAGKCNGSPDDPSEIAPAGSMPECVSASGAVDMSGNAAEWDADGFARGGSATDGSDGRCSKRRKRSPDRAHSDVGFRCCADRR